MPMTARRPSTMNSVLPAEVPQIFWAVQQRLQISELQFDQFATLSSFSSWKTRSKYPGEFFFRFLHGWYVVDPGSGDG